MAPTVQEASKIDQADNMANKSSLEEDNIKTKLWSEPEIVPPEEEYQPTHWKGGLKFVVSIIIFYCVLFAVIPIVIVLVNSVNHHGPTSLALRSTSQEHPLCDTIHIASVCGGYSSSRELYTLLKSILFHRRGYKIHYHLFVDNISARILKKLFGAWTIPDFEVSFYNVTDNESDVSWIPNSHYSNRYGLLKLMVPSILAKRNVSKVILMDTDMIVLGDIKLLWRRFSDLDNEATSFLGLVENQSEWYLSNSHKSSTRVRPAVWPAIGRGFNTGVILIDVTKAMKCNWDELWRDITESELVQLLYTSLADQDIYNAVIKRHSRIAVKLPCYLNIQVNNHTSVDEVCHGHQDQDLNIVHWNTPQKLETSNNMAEYFKGFYLTFKNWNGKLLDRGGCPKPELSEMERWRLSWRQSLYVSIYDYPCHNFHPGPNDQLRTFLFYTDFEVGTVTGDEKNLDDLSIVVHLSMDRFQALEDLAAHWSGPMSVAIYLDESDTSLLDESIRGSASLSGRRNIAYHLTFKVYGWHYPINRLRNIALDNAVTPYVFITDIDFLPSKGLYSDLRQIIRKFSESLDNPLRKKALVVPAFENRQYKFDYPETKDALIEQLNQGKISTFRQDIWKQGQAQTDYRKWKSATQEYVVDWKPDYEPFIVTSRNVTRFDENFIGFGWNKVEHDMTLAAEGYEFIVLPKAFIIHQSHTASRDVKYFRNDQAFHRCINHLKYQVESDLKKKYPEFKKLLIENL